ncbi:hypothetical protein SLE2022_391870 [Rubroshorea leprosula]
MFLYQIPTYHLSGLPELKNPNSKTSPEETRVWSLVTELVAVKVSMEREIVGKKITRDVKNKRMQFECLILQFCGVWGDVKKTWRIYGSVMFKTYGVV